MSRRKKRKRDRVSRERDRSSTPEGAEPAPTAKEPAKRGRRAIELVVLLVGLIAVVIVYTRDQTTFPNTIADGAAEAEPEVALLKQEASQVVDRLVQSFPDSPDALDAIAWTHHQFGKTREATEYWERCLELDPDSAPVCKSLGLIALDGGDVTRAAEYFREAVKLDPDSSEHYSRLGESLLKAGELDEAVRVLAQDLAARPRSIPSLILIGQVYGRLKQYEEAREHLETVIALAPEYTSAYFGLGTACAKLGDPEKSKEYLEQFKLLKAQDAQAHRDALDAADDVASMRTVTAQVCSTAGKVFLSHGDVAAAEELFARAVKHNPDYPEPYRVRAWLYQKQGRVDAAVNELAVLEEKAMDDPAVWMGLGESYSQLEMFEKAEQAFLKLLELASDQSGGYVALTRFYLQANRKLPEAKVLAQKAVQLEPAAEHFSLLAMACRQSGDRAGAIAAADQALTLDPENPDYRRLRELIE